MDQTEHPRRSARRKRNKKRGSGCMKYLFLLAIVLALFWLLRSPDAHRLLREAASLPENPLTTSDFVTADGYVTCTAVPTRRGVDVSEYQENVDWAQVRAAGFDFAFIRIGYRGSTTGAIYEDDLARQNLAGAKAAGLDVGVYFYSQAVSPAEAAEEARWCLDFLSGEALAMPLVYDWEWMGGDSRTAGMDKQTLTECARSFCDTIENAGYGSMIYFNSHVSRDLLDLKELRDFPWWLAQYKEQMDYPYRVDFWQYTETGSVPGIRGNVDIDLMFLYE